MDLIDSRNGRPGKARMNERRLEDERVAELFSRAQSEGTELDDEQLEWVSGGAWYKEYYHTVRCGSCKREIKWRDGDAPPTRCPTCGNTWG